MNLFKMFFASILFFLMWNQISRVAKFGSRFMFGKSGKRWGKGVVQNQLTKIIKKRVEQYVAKRAFFTFLLKLVPFLSILGSEAFFVFLAYNKNKKIARQYITFVESVGKALEKFYRKNPEARRAMEMME